MVEQSMRKQVVKALRKLHAVSVENPAHPGFPDVSYVDGLLELKHVDEWPKRSQTKLRLDHFTQEQKIFLWKRWRAGGNVFLLLNVADDWLLFTGIDAAFGLGVDTKERLMARAFKVWKGSEWKEELRNCLNRSTNCPLNS